MMAENSASSWGPAFPVSTRRSSSGVSCNKLAIGWI
jgi:hypothetical protein